MVGREPARRPWILVAVVIHVVGAMMAPDRRPLRSDRPGAGGGIGLILAHYAANLPE